MLSISLRAASSVHCLCIPISRALILKILFSSPPGSRVCCRRLLPDSCSFAKRPDVRTHLGQIWNTLVLRVLRLSSILGLTTCRHAANCTSARVRKYDVLRSLSQSNRVTSVDLVHAHSNVRLSSDESVENVCTSMIRKIAVIKCWTATKQWQNNLKITELRRKTLLQKANIRTCANTRKRCECEDAPARGTQKTRCCKCVVRWYCVQRPHVTRYASPDFVRPGQLKRDSENTQNMMMVRATVLKKNSVLQGRHRPKQIRIQSICHFHYTKNIRYVIQ